MSIAPYDLGMPDAVAKTPAICLNMIVRNEAHIVSEVLDSVAPHIASWVVVDTGSGDGTQGVIRDHMAALGIPGELYEREWRNAGHNRTEALHLAQGRGDYILTIDADDLLVGAPDFRGLTADVYWLRVRDGQSYWRRHLFRDGVSCHFDGVVHDYSVCSDGLVEERVQGDYYVASRRLGATGLDPLKYARDRDLLLAEVERNPGDTRSVFYLAQSYFDLGDYANARLWYARRVEMGGWAEEVYYSHFRVAEAMLQLGLPWSEVQDAYLRAWEFRPTRAEPLYAIARQYRIQERYKLGYLFAERAAQIPMPEHEALFVADEVYTWRSIDDQAICASFLGKHLEAFTLCRWLLAGDILEASQRCANIVAGQMIPGNERARIAANRDVEVPALLAAVTAYPIERVEWLVANPAISEVTVSLVAGPDRQVTEQTLDSFVWCCQDVETVGRFLVADVGLSIQDRELLAERYPFLEFEPCNVTGGKQLSDIRSRVGSRFWLHLGEGWRFFAPERLITRLTAVLDAQPEVFQVGINFEDADKLTGKSAAEAVVQRGDEAGRYLVVDAMSMGPAMFDLSRFDQIDDDWLGGSQKCSVPSGFRAATLDEVLCVAVVDQQLVSGPEDVELAARETEAFIVEHLSDVPTFAHPHDMLRFALSQCRDPGLALEFGVGRGTTLRIIVDALCGERDVVGFDSFAGLPEAWRPGFPAGWFKQDEQPVVPGARLVVGMFETTLPIFLQENPGRIAFVHLDADLYSSTSTVLRLLGDRLGPDTVLVFDEFFGYPGWQCHEYRAWCEFIAERGARFDYIAYTANNEQIALRLR
jgi:glycosyltransferase involved in cell wall biosynthesis